MNQWQLFWIIWLSENRCEFGREGGENHQKQQRADLKSVCLQNLKTVCLPIVMNTQIFFMHFSTVQLSAPCWSEYNSHLRIPSSGYIAPGYEYMYSWWEYHGIRFALWRPFFKQNYPLLPSREDNNKYARRNFILCQHTKRLPLLEVQQTCWWSLVVIH